MSQTTPLSVEQLRVGHYVVLPFGWKNHPFLFSSFRIKDEEQLQVLRDLGVRSIPVDLTKSIIVEEESEPEPLEPEELAEPEITLPDPHKAEQQAARRSIRQAERNYTNALSPLRESLTRLNLKPDEGLATVAELVRTAATSLTQYDGSVGFHLVRSIRNGDPHLLHSLNVAFIAMLIAKEAGWDPLTIKDAGLAGLVHDIGELRIPTQITRKRGELTKAESNFLKLHVQYGFEQLTQLKAYTNEVRQATLQHHECLDGSGYPSGLKAEQITPLSRLISVVDYYEEQLHPRSGLNAMHPNQVIASLYKKANKQFDSNLIQLLIKVLGVYPPGGAVTLSDGKLALVMSSEPLAPLKPTVLPYEKGRVQEGVDLINLQKDDRTIKAIVLHEDLTQQQQEFFGITKHACYYYSLPH
jgi:HD-GYP domain-containing protein (c-di-GMP phosphodiesterase class II)